MPDMNIVKDFVHGLVSHPIDTLSGKLRPPSPYNKPAYTSTAASTSNAPAPSSPGDGYTAGGSVGRDFDSKIDKAVDDAQK